MSARTDAPDRTALVDMAQGYFRGKVLCAAVRLGIADVLGEGEKSLDELAVATASNRDSLYRFLRALVSMGVVEEITRGRFVLTPFGGPLRRSAPDTVWASMVFWADLLADSWTYLAECVRAGGKSGATAAMEREGVTSRWSREPDAQAIFHAVFAQPNADDMAAYVVAYDFARYSVVADLGGASGGLLTAILRANPHMRGILVDRTPAVADAAPRLKAAGVADRCELLAGDLLEAVPHGASLYVLKCVLHGYDDDNARCVLQNCRAAIPSDGRLLVIEVVLPSMVDQADPVVESLLMGDLNMLAVTGGRERTESEWASLLSSAGFELRAITAVSGVTTRIIEAVPGRTS